jgi:hypothetical protein
MLNPVNSIDATVIERIVYGFPAMAKAIEGRTSRKMVGCTGSSGSQLYRHTAVIRIFRRCFASSGGRDHSMFEGQIAGNTLTHDETIDKIREEVSALDETVTS